MLIQDMIEKLEFDPQKMPVAFLQEAYQELLTSSDETDYSPETIQAAAEWIGFRPELVSACVEMAKQIQAIPEAGEFLKLVKYIVLHDSENRLGQMYWASPCKSRWAAPTMFYVVTFLTCLPHVRELHLRQGVPESATREILLDLESKIDINIRQYGIPGLNTYRWFAEHFNGRIFQTGRLQFQFAPFRFAVNVYKHVSQDKLAILAVADQKFREDGQYFNADRRTSPENALRTTQLIDDGKHLRGTPITSRGCAGAKELELKKDEWQLVLKPGDPILNVHIPANTVRNGPLKYELCTNSYKQAMDFFASYFPKYNYNAFMCETWLLDPQLSDYLDKDSNIVRFQNDFHLLPSPGTNDGGLINFIFGDHFPGWGAVRAETSLQAIAIRHVQTGGSWRVTGGFRLKEEIACGKKQILS
jgi:hypothetical protein